jgi:hypothetical protein
MVATLKRKFSGMAVLCLAGATLMLSPSGAAFAGTVCTVTAPTVTSTNPANTATGVQLTSKLNATLSEAMDPATINTATFTLAGPDAVQVPGTVTSLDTTVTFTPTPATNLAAGTLYTATIAAEAKDLTGNGLASNYVWSFTTGAAPDTTAPWVTYASPANLATGVQIDSKINAAFSEAMDPSTINMATVTVSGLGVTAISGTVAYNTTTNVAAFTPANTLATGSTYTVTVNGAAKDLAGNALLPNNSVWTFTTATQAKASMAPTLGAAAPFGAFGGAAGITNQGISTLVNGDIGTTAAATLITGFHDTAGAVYTETPLNIGTVNGTIYTAPPAPGTAVTSAIAARVAADALIAFNTLSPASLQGGIDVTTLGGGAGELGARTLAPGLYKSAPGSFGITLGDLTLDAGGDPNAVWVFQMASSLTVGLAGSAGAKSVILTNGAQAKNVFWQVGSAATINGAGGGTMVGTIIASAGVSFSTAGNVAITTLNGRALGLNASVTMVNTNINVPAP